MNKLLSLALMLLICTGSFAQSSKEEKLWSRVEALTNAVFETKDSMVMKDLVSERVSYGHSGGNIENKAEMVHKAAVSPTRYKNKSFERVLIDIKGKAAVIRHNFRAISVDEKGVETPLNLGITQVWKKEGGKWRLWARQAVKIPAKS